MAPIVVTLLSLSKDRVLRRDPIGAGERRKINGCARIRGCRPSLALCEKSAVTKPTASVTIDIGLV